MQASRFSSLESAASTAAIEAGRPTASGTIVSGNSVMFVSGRTGISNGTPSRLVDTGGAASLSEFVSASAFGLKNESSVNYQGVQIPLDWRPARGLSGPLPPPRAAAGSRGRHDN